MKQESPEKAIGDFSEPNFDTNYITPSKEEFKLNIKELDFTPGTKAGSSAKDSAFTSKQKPGVDSEDKP